MRTRILGASGLRVSTLGLGTAAWAAGIEKREADRILREFFDAGGTLVDASPLHDSEAVSQLVGSVLSRSNVRDEAIVSVASGINPTRPVGKRVDCSRRAMISDLDEVLQRMQLDYVDLWAPGYWDPATPPAEIMDTLEFAVRSGRVRYVGLRGYTGWQTAVTHAAAERIQPIFAQSEYSLLQRSPDAELLPACEHLGMGFIGGAPLAQGVLTGKYQHSIPEDSRAASEHADAEVQDYLDEHGVNVVGALITAAEGLGVSPAAAALAWARDQAGVSSILVGVRTCAQLRELFLSTEIQLPTQICAALDDVSL